MIRRVDLDHRKRREIRESNAVQSVAGWHNGPSIVLAKPPEAASIHPEVRKMMEMMQRNQLAREAKLRAEFERKLGQGRVAPPSPA